MPILGIDQSLRAPGVCLLSDEGEVLRLFTIDPARRRDAERLAYIRDTVRELYDEGVWFVAQEGYSYNSTSQHFALGEVGGALKLVAHDLRVPCLVVPPATLKKFATGDPQAKKDAMLEAARAATGRASLDDDNQADAYFLAVVAWHVGTERQPKYRAQLEALHTLQHPTKTRRRRVRRLVKNAL